MIELKNRTACFSGHRKIPPERRDTLARRLREIIIGLIENNYLYFGTGGALGFDTRLISQSDKLCESFEPANRMLWKSKKFVFYSVAVVNTHIVIWETIGMEQKEGVKQTLIDGTIRVVARHGPDKTMTRLIATKAGLREMYLYRNFKNKKICSVRLSGLRMPLYQTNSACDTCYDYEAGGLAGERKRLASLKLLRAFHFGEAG